MLELLLHVTWQPEDTQGGRVSTLVTTDIMSLTWNFSSSEVTSPCAWARGVWHLSMHWCTWDMESEGRSQHCALQLNMRPCRGTHRLSDTWDCRDQTGGNKALHARLHVYTYLHFTDVVPLQALDHWFHLILHACLVSLCHLCSPREVFTDVRDEFIK